MIRLAIFDCDGTLVDSGGNIHRALELALGAHGHDCPPRHEAQRVIGLSLEEAMADLVPHGDHALLARTYKDAFFDLRSRGEVHEPLYDGIAELIDALEADGWLLGVATGKSDRGLNHVLEVHGLERRFATLQTADRHPSKPHPSMIEQAMADVGAEAQNVVMIGDTAFDMEMARNAGACALGVAWGYHPVERLRESGAHHVAFAAPEVKEFAERWTTDVK